MPNATIKIADHKILILSILSEHELTEANLIVESNPYAWAISKGIEDGEEDMIGFSFTEVWKDSDNGETREIKKILLKEEINDTDKQNVLQRICMPYDRGRKNFLNTPARFVEHLVRHEIEHCILGKPQNAEHAADEAALQKMNFQETRNTW